MYTFEPVAFDQVIVLGIPLPQLSVVMLELVLELFASPPMDALDIEVGDLLVPTYDTIQ